MNATLSRKTEQAESWPRKVQPGRAIVTVYRRKVGSGFGYLVANYLDSETRRLDSHPDETSALAAAETLAKRLDKRDFIGAAMTKEQSLDFASATETLKPYGLTLSAAANELDQILKQVGDLANAHAAIKFWRERSKTVTKKPVADVVAELLKVKESRGASDRYKADLKSRLERFARDCNKDCCNVTTADIQAWLDAQRVDKKPMSPQSYRNFRTVLGTLFEFAVARGYAIDNPIDGVEKLKARNGDIETFTPIEIERLLAAAQATMPEFLPCIALGAFAGLRSAEIERLQWQDIDMQSRHIVVSAGNAKTASRRIVPVHENLFAWLQPYSSRQGKVWTGTHYGFYDAQELVAAATEIKADESRGIRSQKPVAWKGNALRHSYASYRFALTSDAGRVAGEMGNSASVIHRHYRELVKPAQATAWFAVKPENPSNVLLMPAVAASK